MIAPEAATQYVAVVKAAMNRAPAMQFPRLPGQHRYIAALDEAVRRILTGGDEKNALKTATKKWNDISAELDVEKQKLAYRRSLGINTKR